MESTKGLRSLASTIRYCCRGLPCRRGLSSLNLPLPPRNLRLCLAYATTESEFTFLWVANPALRAFLPPKETWAKEHFRARALGKMATAVRLRVPEF